MTAPNLFHALLSYRPREDRSSKENFLTEAFAYTLRTNTEVCRAWVRSLTGEPPEAFHGPIEVDTQVTLRVPDAKTWSIADMVIRCGLADSSELTLLFEHKWDSKADAGQLRRYCAIAAAKAKTTVVFIGATAMQLAAVKEHSEAVKLLRWQEVHDFLQKNGGDGVHDLVEFLALQGLGPTEPLSWPKLAAYIEGCSVENDCLRIAATLAERDWSFLPARFRSAYAPGKMRWGRIGIELNIHDWERPHLFLGFLLDGTDHQLPLVSPRTSIDLTLMLEADVKTTIDPAVLARRAEALNAPGVVVHHGPQLKSRWRKLVVREALTDTLRGKPSEAEQIDAIYTRLRQWGSLLFEGGELEKALKNL